jgi:hypothetical protein
MVSEYSGTCISSNISGIENPGEASSYIVYRTY